MSGISEINNEESIINDNNDKKTRETSIFIKRQLTAKFSE